MTYPISRIDPDAFLLRASQDVNELVSVKVAGYNQFEYEGQLYPSLTACVKVITGMHYSGRKFFKLGGAPCNK